MHVALHDCDSRRVLISWPVQLRLGPFFHDRRCQTGVTETGASAHFDRNPHGFGDRFSFVSRIERSAHVGVDAKRTTCIVRAGDGDEFLESLRECAVAERRVMQFGVRTVGGRVERRQIA